MKGLLALLLLISTLGVTGCAVDTAAEDEASTVSQELKPQWEFHCGPCHGSTGPGVVVVDDTGDTFYCYGGLGMVECGVGGTWCNTCW